MVATSGIPSASGGRAQAEMRGAAARIEQQPWWRTAVRVGVGARAFAFLILAYIVVRIAMGGLGQGASTKQPASQKGVAQSVAAQSGGHVVVFILGLGVALYALFCAVDAVLHHDETKPRKRWTKRINSAWTAVLYAAFAVYCLRTAFADTSQQSSGEQKQQQTQWTARVLGWPGGQVWLFALGIAVVAAAGVQVFRAVKRKFRKYLQEERMSHPVHTAAVTLGVVGILGRAALYALVGWFVLAAAVEDDPKNGKGFDGAARELADTAAGATLLWVIALMLFAFGAYLLFEARYRELHPTSG